MKLTLTHVERDWVVLGDIPVPARLFTSNLIYVCQECGWAWGRVEVREGMYFPVARSCQDCPPISPRHAPGSFYQYWTDFSHEHLDHWLRCLPEAPSVLAWEFERHLDHAT